MGNNWLTQDRTIPDDAVNYGASGSATRTLNRNGTTQVGKDETINPVTITLEFDVDIWKVYLNGELAAWEYSPGVSAQSAFYASSLSSKGVTIKPASKTEATIEFDPSAMPDGSNTIEVAFIVDANTPDQEIGKTTVAEVEVTDEVDDIGTIGGSSGGCSAGLGAIVSVLAAAFFISRKHS